ncbi:hypothetical protein DFAR_1430015 [Desulfarculales bacterium]
MEMGQLVPGTDLAEPALDTDWR